MQLTKKQEVFESLALSGSNIFLTGKAGTGKTFVVKRVIQKLRDRGVNVVVCAPTGIAASNAGGQTIHSLFSIPVAGIMTYDDCVYVRSEKRRMFNAIETIVFDEVSMLRPDILDAIHLTMRKNGCDGLDTKQLIFVGDLKQLPSPLSDNALSVLFETYTAKEFLASKILSQVDFDTIDLDEVKRQDDHEFIEALNEVREGRKSQFFKTLVHTEPHGVVLAPRNSTVNEYNRKGLSKLSGKEYIFRATYDGKARDTDFSLESEVRVKDGAKIMYLMNSKHNDLRNGTIGVFRVKNGDFFIETNNGVQYLIEPVEILKIEYVLNPATDKIGLTTIGSIKQMPIKLAYAMTIHKSQGLTFDEVTIDLSSPCFQDGQLYTALSRVTTPKGLRIIVGSRI